MANPPWCSCRKCPGYKSLRDRYNIFVCGECLKPSWGVYVSCEKKCEECGGSFYSPWEVVCSDCYDALYALAKQVSDDLRDSPDRDKEVAAILVSCHPGGFIGWAEMAERVRTDPFCAYEDQEPRPCDNCGVPIREHTSEMTSVCYAALLLRRLAATK